jgi:hypothetical protein
MFIDRIDTFDNFQNLKTTWNNIYHQDPEAQFFLSWQWLAGVLENHPYQWMVLVAQSEDGTPLGLLPLYHKTVWSQSRQQLRNEIHFAGRLFWADYGGILCLSEHEEAVLSGLAIYLKQMNWSYLYLKNFRISDRRFAIFMKSFDDERLIVESRHSKINEEETNNLIAPCIELPDTFETYLAEKLSSNTRQKIRRFSRKLESSSEYQITTTDEATRSRDLEILEKLWSEMWRWQKGSKTENLAAKYRKIIDRGLSDDIVHQRLMWHGDTPVGIVASFIDWDKSCLLFFVGGRDKNFNDFPVGLLLHASNISWAIKHGIKTYDLLRGNEPYKYSLGATDLYLKYPSIRTKSGINLNGKLDSGCLGAALGLADDFARRKRIPKAAIACQQILATFPEQEAAKRFLSALAKARRSNK